VTQPGFSQPWGLIAAASAVDFGSTTSAADLYSTPDRIGCSCRLIAPPITVIGSIVAIAVIRIGAIAIIGVSITAIATAIAAPPPASLLHRCIAFRHEGEISSLAHWSRLGFPADSARSYNYRCGYETGD
jgi:hypothetical protein